MRTLDFLIMKNTTPDPYCGYNELCADGASQVVSTILWLAIIFGCIYFGMWLQERRPKTLILDSKHENGE